MIINLLNPLITHSLSKNLTDEELVCLYVETQNINYFNTIYDRYSDRIFAKCLSLLKEVNSAEDATQEIFVKILLALSKFNNRSKFSTWVYSVTYNYCIDVIRKNKKEILSYQDVVNENSVKEEEVSDSEILEMNVQQLSEVMEQMVSEDKMILLMKYHDDLSIKEISRIFNKTESAVKMKILRSKEKFLKIYNQRFTQLNN